MSAILYAKVVGDEFLVPRSVDIACVTAGIATGLPVVVYFSGAENAALAHINACDMYVDAEALLKEPRGAALDRCSSYVSVFAFDGYSRPTQRCTLSCSLVRGHSGAHAAYRSRAWAPLNWLHRETPKMRCIWFDASEWVSVQE